MEMQISARFLLILRFHQILLISIIQCCFFFFLHIMSYYSIIYTKLININSTRIAVDELFLFNMSINTQLLSLFFKTNISHGQII